VTERSTPGLKPPASMPKDDREFQSWCRKSFDQRILRGEGSPEGVVIADRGWLYLRTDGSTSTTLYVKTADDGEATGWTAK
jgi:hypothetical protein